MTKDNLLLEQAYYQILAEQQRLIEEGKIWDFIKSMGSKLKNAWDILNVKLISNPKIYKGLVVAGPIIASLLAKNFQNTDVNSDTVKSLLETLNGVDPNISTEDLSDMLAKWDQEHAASLGKFTQHSGGGFSSSDINVADQKDGTYSFTGTHLNTTEGDDVVGQASKTFYVQNVVQTLEQITTKSDISTVVTDFVSEISKSSNVDGSGGTVVIEYSGTVSASSPEEAMKIMNELVKAAIEKSEIDTKNLSFIPSKPTLVAAAESFNMNSTAIYLTELQALDKMKSAVKSAVSGAVGAVKSGAGAAVEAVKSGTGALKSGVKNLVIGAKDIVNKIKSSFKKTPGAPEQQYKVTLKVGIKAPAK